LENCAVQNELQYLKWGKAIHLHDYSLLQPATKQPYFAHFYPSAGAAFTAFAKSAWNVRVDVGVARLHPALAIYPL